VLSVPVQVIAWRTVSEMTYNVLNVTHSLWRNGRAESEDNSD